MHGVHLLRIKYLKSQQTFGKNKRQADVFRIDFGEKFCVKLSQT